MSSGASLSTRSPLNCSEYVCTQRGRDLNHFLGAAARIFVRVEKLGPQLARFFRLAYEVKCAVFASVSVACIKRQAVVALLVVPGNALLLGILVQRRGVLHSVVDTHDLSNRYFPAK